MAHANLSPPFTLLKQASPDDINFKTKFDCTTAHERGTFQSLLNNYAQVASNAVQKDYNEKKHEKYEKQVEIPFTITKSRINTVI
jgi:hypothetical protein